MKKNVLMVILVLVLAALSVSEAVNSVVGYNDNTAYSYSVDQYRLPDGCIITIDWNQAETTEYKNVTMYKGCINNNGYLQFWYTDATTWYIWIYEHIEEGNCQEYLTTLTEWRW